MKKLIMKIKPQLTPTNDNLAMNMHSCDVNDNTAVSAVEASSRPLRQATVLGEAI